MSTEGKQRYRGPHAGQRFYTRDVEILETESALALDDQPVHNTWVVLYREPEEVPGGEGPEGLIEWKLRGIGTTMEVTEETMEFALEGAAPFGAGAPPLLSGIYTGVYSPGGRVWIIRGLQRIEFVRTLTLEQAQAEAAGGSAGVHPEDEWGGSGGGQGKGFDVSLGSASSTDATATQ
jgi:hypothetical protein